LIKRTNVKNLEWSPVNIKKLMGGVTYTTHEPYFVEDER